MGARAFWKGYLKLSLVTCPVTMTPATTPSRKVRFHTLNRATGNRVESRYVDIVSGKPVREADEVKGYEILPDQYVMLDDKEIQRVALESTRTIDIETFVPKDAIDRVWYDRPHYLRPDDSVAAEAFAVIRAAMTATGTVGIARLVLYRREHAVLLVPRDPGIVLWTLHYGDERRDPPDEFAAGAKPSSKAQNLLLELIDARTRPWDQAYLRDQVQEKLLRLVKKKGKAGKAGQKPPADPPAQGHGGNIISIMEALQQSIEGKGRNKGR